jgi:hypothetical protein
MKLRIFIILLIILIIGGGGYIGVKKFILKKTKVTPAIDRSKIRIEIINCSGINKQGSRTQDYLRSAGFDVYEVRSSNRLIDKTAIIERIDQDCKNALAVSEAMTFIKKSHPIPVKTIRITPEIQKDIDSLLYIDITVILGKDCEQFLPKANIIP